ncbi:hypothetical protein [Streptococcus jiangjianxini]|uniref:hypothetical protein n=1 Tax=Streptococcus jiangjianxini TaxID=3161189 RepID=UPI0032EDE3C2
MHELTLSIKPKVEPSENQGLLSRGYEIKIGDWVLGRGVTDFKLEMPAGQKPKATITFIPQKVVINDMVAEIQILESESKK